MHTLEVVEATNIVLVFEWDVLFGARIALPHRRITCGAG